MRRSLSIRLLLLSCLLHPLLGCGGGPRAAVMEAVEHRNVRQALVRYERFRDEEGPDGRLLAPVAGLILQEEAGGEDAERSRAAIGQLALAGSPGQPVLERLATGGQSVGIRARALGALARRGDRSALDALRALLDDEDSEVLAAAVVSLDPEEDVDRLITLLTHTAGDVRKSAARQLSGSSPIGRARASLAEAARVDPLPDVRATAVRSLGNYGGAVFESLRERLSDADSGVRMAAVGALVRADRERALSAIGPLLEMTPSRAGIEAARVLADVPADAEPAEGAVLARAFLRRALSAGEVETRSQAAVALSSLPVDPGLEQALLQALESEEEPRVRLSLALGLHRREAVRGKAERALTALLEDEGMPGVQAASLLAKGGDRDALRHLARALRRGEPLIRRVAARAMAREALRPDAARRALRDEDALVRIHAAGGILAASSSL